MPNKDEEDKNSITSDTEEVDIRDKEEDDDEDDDEETVKNDGCNDDEEDEEDEDEDEEEDDDEDEDEDEDEEDDDEDGDDEEYDQNIIQFELFKNFLVDDEGNNVATNLKAVAHELRTLNKIAKLFLKDK